MSSSAMGDMSEHQSPPRQDVPPAVSRRRQSLPVHSTPNAPNKHRANIPAASPEVISSLISSLSTISTPAQTHFDSFPKIGSHTAPSSPRADPTDPVHDVPDPQSSPGFGMDYGAYKVPADDSEHDFLHPDDAAMPPVVRMAKPPPSPRSSRSRRSSRGPPEDTIPLRTGSRASHTSSKAGQDDNSNFGTVSLDPGPRMSNTSIASSSSGDRKSSKGSLGLLKRLSREFSKEKDTDRLSTGNGGRLNSSRSRLSLRSSHSMADVAEEKSAAPGLLQNEDVNLESARQDFAPNPSPPQSSVSTLNLSPGGIGSGRAIPTRESSLRHSYSGTSSKKSRSARHSGYSTRDFTIDRHIAEVNAEDDQVTKRIREIKNQQKKIKDELITDDKPSTLQSSISKPSSQLSSSQPVGSLGASAHRRSRDVSQQSNKSDQLDVDLEDSAPSPTVLTRRVLSVNKRNGTAATKATNIQPVPGRQSLEKSDDQKKEKRRSNTASLLETKNDSRARSGALSPIPLSTSVDDRPSSADSIDEAVDAYVTSSRLTQKVPHPQTGRVIAFSEVGDPKGHVVFCCVGMGLTRLLTAFYDELARTLKLRLITPDRPGVGESEPCMDGTGTPLSWPDDLAIICNFLKITKFSILAHSAGAIYALATALRMPQHIRGRIHLLAPWIPPSQMTGMGSHKDPLPANALPYSQRILRALPTPLLKVANSSFMTVTSASITSSLPRSSRRTKRRNTVGRETPAPAESGVNNTTSHDRSSIVGPQGSYHRSSQDTMPRVTPNPNSLRTESALSTAAARADQERQSSYDNRLTHAIWDLATTNANPAVDLLICLERRQSIGFRYVDINRAVVIHHGSRDTRVPVDNVRWLGKTMRRCEVRILEGEGHGLMASATVMGNVLMEVAKEWEDWTTIVQGRKSGGRRATVTTR